MTDFGFQPFPEPDPYHGADVALQYQAEEYVMPTDPGEMIRRSTTGRSRLIITASAERMQPYYDAVMAIWKAEQT